jgi:lysozyme family protein
VPWYLVGIIHYRECSLYFSRHLHNGEPLTERTRRVPAGRPASGGPGR